MKSYWKTIGLVALGAALVYYPGMRLYKYLAARGKGAAEDLADEGGEVIKHLFNHKAHKPHHRKAGADGHLS